MANPIRDGDALKGCRDGAGRGTRPRGTVGDWVEFFKKCAGTVTKVSGLVGDGEKSLSPRSSLVVTHSPFP